jgi:23S rRNA (uridine2552-2'-O)-methyltransferase
MADGVERAREELFGSAGVYAMKRNKTSKAWMQRHVTDPYVRWAREQGYRSRAAFKLLEIAERDRLLRPGLTVVDLGAAPGGWAQAAARFVGPTGRVIALDVTEMAPLPGVTFILGDIQDAAALARLEQALEDRHADLVISDMAPNLSGVAATDQAGCIRLADLALEFAMRSLQPGGSFLVKLFQGSGYDGFVCRIRAGFEQVRVRKPKASRDSSREVYLLAQRPTRGGSAASGTVASP